MTTFGGWPTGFGGFGNFPTTFYDPFFTDPFLTADDFDMLTGPSLLPPSDQNQWLLQQQGGGREDTGGLTRSQRRSQAREQRRQALQQRQTARVNLVQEEEKYCVCVEVPGRTKDDLCVSLEANILKVSLVTQQ